MLLVLNKRTRPFPKAERFARGSAPSRGREQNLKVEERILNRASLGELGGTDRYAFSQQLK
jgi:hypothetical protein